MTNIHITKKNETYIIIKGDACIIQELDDAFSFYAEGYKFQPKYKQKLWDGKIRLVKRKNSQEATVYLGLLEELIKYFNKHDYSYQIDPKLKPNNAITKEELTGYLKELRVSSKGQEITPRDYQAKGFIDAIQNKRQLILSVTSCLDPESEINCIITQEGYSFLEKIRNKIS